MGFKIFFIYLAYQATYFGSDLLYIKSQPIHPKFLKIIFKQNVLFSVTLMAWAKKRPKNCFMLYEIKEWGKSNINFLLDWILDWMGKISSKNIVQIIWQNYDVHFSIDASKMVTSIFLNLRILLWEFL